MNAIVRVAFFETAVAGLVAGVVAGAISGCSSTTLIRAAQQSRMTPFAEAKAQLPPQPADAMRLYVYRPQALAGMWGNAIVIVGGTRMGNPANPTADNRLLPGAVFVVDTPARSTRVWWEQAGRGEETELAFELDPAKSRVWFLRWDLKATYGYLRPVDEAQARAQIEPLGFSGYVNLMPR
jgi:hypothetical protein